MAFSPVLGVHHSIANKAIPYAHTQEDAAVSTSGLSMILIESQQKLLH